MQEEVLSLLENHLLKKLQTLEKSKTFRSLYFTVPEFLLARTLYQHQRAKYGNLFQNIPTVIRVL
jgi:hypothetical protein